MEQLIRDEMRVLPTIDPHFEIERRVSFIKRKLLESGCKALVLGISGGVDSTTCGRLAQLAVNELNAESGTNAYQFIAVRLPYGEQKDEDEAQLALSLSSQLIPFPSTSNRALTAYTRRHTER